MTPATWTLLAICLACTALQAQGYQYIGCFADGGDRDLPLRADNSGSMTVQRCSDLCTTRKYPYFGLQAGNECWCGNGFGKHGPKPTSECSRECPGDRNQMCGNGWRNSMYTSDFDFGLRFVGCYVDAENRDLTVLAGEGVMSITKCYNLCRQRKYAYFGVQFGDQCWCDNSYGKYGSSSTEDCNMRCTGERAELCGAAWRNSLYTTGLSPLSLPPSTDPLHPSLRDQLAAQIRTQFIAFPKDVLCTTCLISTWRRRDVIVHSKVIPVRDLNAVLATYPDKVRQKVLPLQYGSDAKTSFEDFSHQISGSNAFRRTYIGVARRVGDNIQLAMVDSNIEAGLSTNFNVYYHRVCRKILWIFTKCYTHQIPEIRGYEPNEIALIDKAMQSEIFRLLGERLTQVNV